MKYFIFKDSRILGPFGLEDIRQSGELHPETLVCREGAGHSEMDWKSLDEVPELARLATGGGGQGAAVLGGQPSSLPGEGGGPVSMPVRGDGGGVFFLDDAAPSEEGFASGAIEDIFADFFAPTLRLDGPPPEGEGGVVSRQELAASERRVRDLSADVEALVKRVKELETQQEELLRARLDNPIVALRETVAPPAAPEPPSSEGSRPPSPEGAAAVVAPPIELPPPVPVASEPPAAAPAIDIDIEIVADEPPAAAKAPELPKEPVPPPAPAPPPRLGPVAAPTLEGLRFKPAKTFKKAAAKAPPAQEAMGSLPPGGASSHSPPPPHQSPEGTVPRGGTEGLAPPAPSALDPLPPVPAFPIAPSDPTPVVPPEAWVAIMDPLSVPPAPVPTSAIPDDAVSKPPNPPPPLNQSLSPFGLDPLPAPSLEIAPQLSQPSAPPAGPVGGSPPAFALEALPAASSSAPVFPPMPAPPLTMLQGMGPTTPIPELQIPSLSLPQAQASAPAPPPATPPSALPPLTPQGLPPVTMAYSISPGVGPATPIPFASPTPQPEPESTTGGRDLISRLAKPETAPSQKSKPRRARMIAMVVGGGLVIAVLVGIWGFFLRDDAGTKEMFQAGKGDLPLEGEGEEAMGQGASVPPSGESRVDPGAPASKELGRGPAVPAAPAVGAAEDPSPAAIELVKSHPLDSERGTVGQWLEYSFAANPGDAAREAWTAGGLDSTTYSVEYKVTPAAAGGLPQAPIHYVFEVDLARRSVSGRNPAAKELLAPKAPSRPDKAPKPAKARKPAKPAVVSRPAPARTSPALPLPDDSELAPPAEDGAPLSSDTVEPGL